MTAVHVFSQINPPLTQDISARCRNGAAAIETRAARLPPLVGECGRALATSRRQQPPDAQVDAEAPQSRNERKKGREKKVEKKLDSR